MLLDYFLIKVSRNEFGDELNLHHFCWCDLFSWLLPGSYLVLARTDHKNQEVQIGFSNLKFSHVPRVHSFWHPWSNLPGNWTSYKHPSISTLNTWTCFSIGDGWGCFFSPRYILVTNLFCPMWGFWMSRDVETTPVWIGWIFNNRNPLNLIYYIYIESWTISTSFPNLSCLKTVSVFSKAKGVSLFRTPQNSAGATRPLRSLHRCKGSSDLYIEPCSAVMATVRRSTCIWAN